MRRARRAAGASPAPRPAVRSPRTDWSRAVRRRHSTRGSVFGRCCPATRRAALRLAGASPPRRPTAPHGHTARARTPQRSQARLGRGSTAHARRTRPLHPAPRPAPRTVLVPRTADRRPRTDWRRRRAAQTQTEGSVFPRQRTASRAHERAQTASYLARAGAAPTAHGPRPTVCYVSGGQAQAHADTQTRRQAGRQAGAQALALATALLVPRYPRMDALDAAGPRAHQTDQTDQTDDWRSASRRALRSLRTLSLSLSLSLPPPRRTLASLATCARSPLVVTSLCCMMITICVLDVWMVAMGSQQKR